MGLARIDAIELPLEDGTRLPPLGYAGYVDGRLRMYVHVVMAPPGESGRFLQITHYDEGGVPLRVTTVHYPSSSSGAISPASSVVGSGTMFLGRVTAFCSAFLSSLFPKPLLAVQQGDEECHSEETAMQLAFWALVGASGAAAAVCTPPIVNPVACLAASVTYAAAGAYYAWRQDIYNDCVQQQSGSGQQEPVVVGGSEPLDVEDNCELWGVYVSQDGGYTFTLHRAAR